jgi:hypothetical protein
VRGRQVVAVTYLIGNPLDRGGSGRDAHLLAHLNNDLRAVIGIAANKGNKTLTTY